MVDPSSTPLLGDPKIPTVVARVPPETLALIFLNVVDPRTAHWLDVINHRGNILYVCRRWRDVASSLSVLWSTIYVARPILPSFLQEVLWKTGPSTNLFVDINPLGFRTIRDRGVLRNLKLLLFAEFLKLLVGLLRGVFHRVRSLAVFDGHRSEMFEVMDLVGGFSATSLSSLRVYASRDSEGSAPNLPAGLHLTELTLATMSPLWACPALYAGLTKLTLCEFRALEWPELRKALHNNTTLVELHMKNVCCIGWTHGLNASTPNVTRFTLEYREDSDKRFLGSILMPALRDLNVDVDANASLLYVADDMQNILRSVKNIWLDARTYVEEDLADVIATCTSAEILNLRFCRPYPYDALRILSGMPGISWPHLRLLKISGSMTEEEALVLLRSPFPVGLVVSEWVMDDSMEFKEWTLDGKELRVRTVKDTGDGRQSLGVETCLAFYTDIGNGNKGTLFLFKTFSTFAITPRYLPSFDAAHWTWLALITRGTTGTKTKANLDLSEPLLSAYNYAAVRILAGRPYDEHWNAVLSTVNVISLFKLALQTQWLFDIVMAHVRAHQPASGNCLENLEGGPLDRLSAMPNELFCLILPNLSLGDRQSLSRVSRKMASLCSRELQAGLNRLLKRFSLCHAEIRFMQSATMTVLGGQSIPHLLNYDCLPNYLDFHAPDVTYKSVLRFFTLATGCEGRPAIFNNLNAPEGFDDSTRFVQRADETEYIRVLRSLTNSGLDSITYSPFTHLFGAVTHYGLWLAYANTSTTGLTMPNRECLDFDDPATEDRVSDNYKHFSSHFSLADHLYKPHDCGIDWECTMTVRSTIDDGCVSIFFPSPPMGENVLPDVVYPSESVMLWCLGGGICPRGVSRRIGEDGVHEVRRRFDSYSLRALEHFLSDVVDGVNFAAPKHHTLDIGSKWTF
ncbi:hypothetical protein C8F04DRAFT_1178959 [Mycena alexandri]|uniref:F-box domain-containing protein n=1 Tax=Mycena alexandri TaxID=1745969 RepID=A0AAD6T573_9AGAR|nr:hypothetical protein C8F04DRAFT_1178959 [Mycena alexandri]